MSLNSRLVSLEDLAKPGAAEETDPVERERRRAAFREMVEGAATEGNPARRRALEQLIESMKRRASMRRRARES